MRALGEDPLGEVPPPGKVALRAPFVRRCALDFGDGKSVSAFLVNINVLGVYVAHDDMPRLGQALRVRFSVPDSERELALGGVVAWVNPRQQHPVHSLPRGFGVKFTGLDPDSRRSIEHAVADYAARNPAGK